MLLIQIVTLLLVTQAFQEGIETDSLEIMRTYITELFRHKEPIRLLMNSGLQDIVDNVNLLRNVFGVKDEEAQENLKIVDDFGPELDQTPDLLQHEREYSLSDTPGIELSINSISKSLKNLERYIHCEYSLFEKYEQFINIFINVLFDAIRLENETKRNPNSIAGIFN